MYCSLHVVSFFFFFLNFRNNVGLDFDMFEMSKGLQPRREEKGGGES